MTSTTAVTESHNTNEHEGDILKQNGSQENRTMTTKVAPEDVGLYEPAHKSVWFKIGLTITNAMEYLIHLIDGSRNDSLKWIFMEGNFAPNREEILESSLRILEGNMPKDLPDGAFFRTGPNPQFDPNGRYHWFDGDGMVHSVRIKNGQASYCNRFVKTSKFNQEKAVKQPLTAKFGDMRGMAGLLHILLDKLRKVLGLIDDSSGLGTSNTALAFHAGRLLALHEGDCPYWLRITCEGLIDTIGRCTFDGKLSHSFTAHPKIDPKTQEMFAFGYKIDEKYPACYVMRHDSDGRQVTDYRIDLPKPVMMHDCALTEKHFIIVDVPLVFDPKVMVKENRLPFKFDKSYPARFGVVDRYSQDGSGIQWFCTEPMMIFHVANAWERDDGTIELYVCAFKEFDLSSVENISESTVAHLTRIELDTITGKTTCQEICRIGGDFPVVPASLVGRKTKFAYIASMELDAKMPVFNGICKVDLSASSSESSVVGQIHHGDGRYGGEAYFVPSRSANKEDDGYLMTYVWDENTTQSEFVVYSSKTMSSVPVVRIALPHRVPYGFHALWVDEKQIQQQDQS